MPMRIASAKLILLCKSHDDAGDDHAGPENPAARRSRIFVSGSDIQDLAHPLRRPGEDRAVAPDDDRPLDELRVLGHRVEDLVVGQVLAGEAELSVGGLAGPEEVARGDPHHPDQPLELVAGDRVDVVVDRLVLHAGFAEDLRELPAGGARRLFVDDDAVVGGHGLLGFRGFIVPPAATPSGPSGPEGVWRRRVVAQSFVVPRALGGAPARLPLAAAPTSSSAPCRSRPPAPPAVHVHRAPSAALVAVALRQVPFSGRTSGSFPSGSTVTRTTSRPPGTS